MPASSGIPITCTPLLLSAALAATAGSARAEGHISIAQQFGIAYLILDVVQDQKYDILGGPATFNVLYTTQKFHDENPKTYKAFYAALTEASQFIQKNKTKAAETFIRVQKSKLPLDFVKKILDDPENDFTVSPYRTYVYADALYKLGVLKNKATSWKDYFFEEAFAAPGN